jgi:dihydropyrimidinase
MMIGFEAEPTGEAVARDALGDPTRSEGWLAASTRPAEGKNSMLDVAVNGGLVCLPGADPQPLNVGVKDGVVAVLGSVNEALHATTVVDADGKLVLPGFIDPHVHAGVYNELGEDLRYLTRFAALGGMTSIVPFFRPATSYLEALPGALDTFSQNSYLDYSFILGITKRLHLTELTEVSQMYGIRAFKFYLGYCGNEQRFGSDFPFSDDHLVAAFEQLRNTPGDPLLCVHCENAAISRYYHDKFQGEKQNLALYDRINPVVSELDSAVHVSLLGEHYGVRTCIVHVSAGTTAATLKSLPWRDCRRNVLETCPHYLCFDVDDPAGLRGVVRPPVRTKAEADLLWQYVADGTLDTLGSDNCANRLEDKLDKDVYTTHQLGMGELGLTLPLMLSQGHFNRGIPLPRIVAMGSENVARTHGIFPRKGALLPGSDADIVIVDPDREQTVDPMQLKDRDEGSIYAGRTLRGWPVTTIARGRLLVDDTQFVGELGHAQFLSETATATT